MSEEDLLPPAHPAFAAHFTSRFYDADDPGHNELPPFGTDEGADGVSEWGGRLDVLERARSLRELLGEDADEQIADLRGGDSADGDDLLVSLGFTFLRYTGRIDAEGRDWLLEALRRQIKRYPGIEYATMLQDLSIFAPQSHPGGATPRPAEPWLDIRYGGGDSGLDRWCRRWVHAADADLAWRDWWAAADLNRLTLYPHIDTRRNYVKFNPSGRRALNVIGASVRLGTLVRVVQKRSSKPSHPPQAPFLSVPEFEELFESLLLQMLHRTADHLGLPAPA